MLSHNIFCKANTISVLDIYFLFLFKTGGGRESILNKKGVFSRHLIRYLQCRKRVFFKTLNTKTICLSKITHVITSTPLRLGKRRDDYLQSFTK